MLHKKFLFEILEDLGNDIHQEELFTIGSFHLHLPVDLLKYVFPCTKYDIMKNSALFINFGLGTLLYTKKSLIQTCWDQGVFTEDN